jgi:DNA-binding transcriptional ArsR family regulator
MPRPPIHFITTPKAWSVYIAPVRIELLETMRMVAPCSIAELAAALDRPADTLYRHIEKLRKIGVVVEAGVRRSGRRFEQVYDLAGDDFRPAFRDASPRITNKLFNDAAQSIAKILSRTARDAAAAEQIVFWPTERNASVKFEHAWLSPEDFDRLRGLLVGIKEFMDARKTRREGRLYLAAFAAVPVHRRRAARVKSGKPEAARSGSARSTGAKSKRAAVQAKPSGPTLSVASETRPKTRKKT